MTKPKEPSKATMKAWYDAETIFMKPSLDDGNIRAARIIQRHVDREVRKAVNQARKNAEALLIQSAKESGFAAKIEVVKCAEYLAEASDEYSSRTLDASLEDNLRMAMKERICINQLIAAVKAMKEGKK